MKTGFVVGKVWATKRLPELPSGALLKILLDSGGTSRKLLHSIRLVVARANEYWCARVTWLPHWFDQQHPLVDALVIGMVDGASKRGVAFFL